MSMGDDADEVPPGPRPIVWHLAAYVALNALLATAFFVNKGRMAMFEINGIFDYWPLWIHLGWGALLFGHFVLTRRTSARIDSGKA